MIHDYYTKYIRRTFEEHVKNISMVQLVLQKKDTFSPDSFQKCK